MLSPNEKIEKLKLLRTECYGCTLCPLHLNKTTRAPGRKPCVFGAGKATANVVFVGQNPGLTEMQQGRPFVGASGRVLDKALETVGIDRKLVYITNGVLCYTIDNSLPKDESVEQCRGYLISQLDIISPKAVVVLGKSAARSFNFGEQFSVGLCKTNKSWKTPLHDNVFFTVHPAYTIYSKPGMEILLESLRFVKDLV